MQRSATDGTLIHELPGAAKAALTRDPLEVMLANCTDGLIGVRDRALLLFAFSSGGRRRSEVAAAVMANLMEVNSQTYIYRLTHSKSDQSRTEHNPDADKPLLGPAVQALTAWLEASGVTSGAIFRRVRKTFPASTVRGERASPCTSPRVSARRSWRLARGLLGESVSGAFIGHSCGC